MANLSPYTSPWKLLNMYDQLYMTLIDRSISTTFGTLHSLENESIEMIPINLIRNDFLNDYLQEELQPSGETLLYQNRYQDGFLASLLINSQYQIRYSSGSKCLRKTLEKGSDWIDYTSNKIFKDMLIRDNFMRDFDKYLEKGHPHLNSFYQFYFNVQSWLRLMTPALIVSLQVSLIYKLIRGGFIFVSFIVILPYIIYTLTLGLSSRKSINQNIFYIIAGITGIENILALVSVVAQLSGGCGFCNLGSIQYFIILIIFLIILIFQWLYDRGHTGLFTVCMCYLWTFLLEILRLRNGTSTGFEA